MMPLNFPVFEKDKRPLVDKIAEADEMYAELAREMEDRDKRQRWRYPHFDWTRDSDFKGLHRESLPDCYFRSQAEGFDPEVARENMLCNLKKQKPLKGFRLWVYLLTGF